MSEFTKGPISAVLTDSRGYVLGTDTPIPVDPAESGAANYATSQVTVSSSSATQLLSVNATRRAALVTNQDASINIFVGASNVTTSTGHRVAPGLSLTLPVTGAIYAKAASGSPTASVTEVYD
jgi:hypothetical protein